LAEKAIADYEWIADDGKNHREWLIPAQFIKAKTCQDQTDNRVISDSVCNDRT